MASVGERVARAGVPATAAGSPARVWVDPQTDRRWAALIRRPGSSVFHSQDWIGALTVTYGFDIRAFMLVDAAGDPRAGLTVCALDEPGGRRTVSMPFSDYCDPLVDDSDQWNRLTAGLTGAAHPLSIRCLHNRVVREDSRLVCIGRARWHGLDVDGPLDGLWHGLDGSAKRAIRKAERNVVVRPAERRDELRRFYELHLRVRKHKYRLLAQPYAFFEQLWQRFVERGCGVLLLAYHQGRIIGGALFLEWQGTLYYKFNASDPDFIALRPNDLVIWEAVKLAQSRRLSRLDFGLSDWDQTGLIRFKRKFASDEGVIAFLQTASDATPARPMADFRARLGGMTRLLTEPHVPDDVTERAGEILYRFFT